MAQVIVAGKASLRMVQWVPVMTELFSFNDLMIPNGQSSITGAQSVQTHEVFCKENNFLSKIKNSCQNVRSL
jgi:hypothetical protein